MWGQWPYLHFPALTILHSLDISSQAVKGTGESPWRSLKRKSWTGLKIPRLLQTPADFKHKKAVKQVRLCKQIYLVYFPAEVKVYWDDLNLCDLVCHSVTPIERADIFIEFQHPSLVNVKASGQRDILRGSYSRCEIVVQQAKSE